MYIPKTKGSKGMEGSSSASSCYIHDHDDNHLIYDLYFSALYDAQEIFLFSDEKCAEELQLQEVLYSSATSSTRDKNKVIQGDVEVVCDDTTLITLKGKRKCAGQSSQVFCAICMEAKPGEEMFRNQKCSHSFCHACVRTYVASKIQENISMVKCPEPKCKGVIEPQYCRSIIPKEVFDRWEIALCESSVLASQKIYCPFKDCSAMLVSDIDEEADTVSECPHCHRLFCARCKVSWHEGIDCGQFQNLHEGEREREDLLLMELAKNNNWRRCPKCKIYVEKTNGCNHVSCRCGNEFCYACGSSWSSIHLCSSG